MSGGIQKRSAIGFLMTQRGTNTTNLANNFKILNKCKIKLDCLICDVRFFFIDIHPLTLTRENDSLRLTDFKTVYSPSINCNFNLNLNTNISA